MVALFLTAPATAWDSHELQHLSSPMAADVHHHHHDDGSVADLDEAAHGSEHQQDGSDEGHDHLPSLSAAFSAVTADGPELALPMDAEILLRAIRGEEPPNLPSSPQIRPPRFA